LLTFWLKSTYIVDFEMLGLQNSSS